MSISDAAGTSRVREARSSDPMGVVRGRHRAVGILLLSGPTREVAMDPTWKPCVGLLHPGAMGATVGAAAMQNVQRVLWASEGRSAASRQRAEGAGLSDAKGLEDLIRQVDLLVSVCPPAAALGLAKRVGELGYRGVFVDANAVSPDTARQIAAAVERGGASAVDAGIIGPPAQRAGTTTLHLSGERAGDAAACFAEGPIEARILDGPIGAASALKMAFAAYSKGTAALLAAIHSLALAEGVEGELRLERFKDAAELPSLEAIAEALRDRSD
jgi:3-hydroxyisobutyrate dehydrogenase-like beta-hydroxyacid dehydrogenase